MYILGVSTSSFKNDVLFEGNKAPSNGGAYYAESTSVSNFENAIFRNNETGANGGAIFAQQNAILNFNKDALFETNKSTTNGLGGALYLQNSAKANFADVTFKNNEARNSNGGAVYMKDSTTLNVTGNALFENNKAKTGGGLCIIDSRSMANFFNATFRNNEANSLSGYGGAIYLNTAALNIAGSALFENNKAAYGGGTYIKFGTANFFNSTFRNNEAAYFGGAIYADVNANINFAITDSADTETVWEGNKANGIGNFMYINPSTLNEMIKINFDIADQKTLKIEDPFTSAPGIGKVKIDKTGLGTWSLRGDNRFNSDTDFTISSGTFILQNNSNLYLNPNLDTKITIESETTFVTNSSAQLTAKRVEIKDGVKLKLEGIGNIADGKQSLQNYIITNDTNSYVAGENSSFVYTNNLLKAYFTENSENAAGKNFDLILNVKSLGEVFKFDPIIDLFRTKGVLSQEQKDLFDNIYATGYISESLQKDLQDFGKTLTGDIFFASNQATFGQINTLNRRIGNRLDNFHFADSREGTQFAALGLMTDMNYNAAEKNKVWAMISSRKIEQKDQDKNIGYDYDPTGITIGYDRVLDKIVIGGAVHLDNGEVKSKNDSTKTTIYGTLFSLYGSYNEEKWYLNTGVDFGFSTNKEETYYKLFNAKTEGEYDTNLVGLNGEFGYLAYEIASIKSQIVPHVGINAARIATESFVEKGEASLSRIIDKMETNVIELPIGLKFTNAMKFDKKYANYLSSFLDVSYGFNLGNKQTETTGRFLASSNSEWKIKGAEIGDAIRIKLGVDLTMYEKFNVGVGYTMEMRDDYTDQEVNLKVSYAF